MSVSQNAGVLVVLVDDYLGNDKSWDDNYKYKDT